MNIAKTRYTAFGAPGFQKGYSIYGVFYYVNARFSYALNVCYSAYFASSLFIASITA